MMTTYEVLTLGDLERELRQDCPHLKRHQLTYAIASRGITPVARAGIARVWARSQLGEIKAALSDIASREVAIA